jgi:hypothetical protein
MQVKKKLKIIPLIIIVLMCCTNIHAQLSRSQIKRNNTRLQTYRGNIKNGFGIAHKYSTISISVGTLNYYGDLSPTQKKISTDISLSRPGLGFGYSKRLTPRFALDASFFYGSIEGSDAASANKNDLVNAIYRYQRNLSFRNRIEELTLVTVIDLYKNEDMYVNRVSFTPYIIAGIGVMHHNPQATVPSYDLLGNPFANAGKWVDLHKLGTEGQYSTLQNTDVNYGIKPYKLFQVVIPIGMGARLRLTNNFDLSAEFSIRYLFTDYLDDVSKNYVDLGSFTNNELGKALSYRSNELVQPTYTYHSERDGQSYKVIAGYGSEHRDNMRGNRKDNDIYTAFVLKLSYGFVKFSRPKFR